MLDRPPISVFHKCVYAIFVVSFGALAMAACGIEYPSSQSDPECNGRISTTCDGDLLIQCSVPYDVLRRSVTDCHASGKRCVPFHDIAVCASCQGDEECTQGYCSQEYPYLQCKPWPAEGEACYERKCAPGFKCKPAPPDGGTIPPVDASTEGGQGSSADGGGLRSDVYTCQRE